MIIHGTRGAADFIQIICFERKMRRLKLVALKVLQTDFNYNRNKRCGSYHISGELIRLGPRETAVQKGVGLVLDI